MGLDLGILLGSGGWMGIALGSELEDMGRRLWEEITLDIV